MIGESEVEDDVEGGLEIVLCLVEEGGVDPVEFAANGKAGVKAIVEADAGLRGKRAAAVVGGLRLQVSASYERVGPRFEPVAAPADAESAAAAEILHMFILENCGGEAGDDVALNSEPAVGEVADGGVSADETGVDDA